ncbi:MAG TPA: DUF2269 domain-containing protein [Burkholderiales bacterium]|nr:DUF2269 domain-containing protein [Burkholderiales bacterium]
MADIALWKTAHIVSAAVLFGTGVGIAFFCWVGCRRSLRSGDLASLRTILRLTVIADACFTAPAVLFQAISGVVLMNRLGWPLISAWSSAVWLLFAFVGACWLPVVAIQIMLRRESESVASIDALSVSFRAKLTWWFALGVPAFGAVLIVFYLMVAKPLSVLGR